MMENKLILNIDEKPEKISKWLSYSFQHLLAMFVANTLIAIIVFNGYSMVPAALISAGVGTLIYLFITKLKSPVFLGSSAALISVMSSCFAMNELGSGNWIALVLGLSFVGIIYVLLGLLITKLGTAWLFKLLPPVVTGSVIIVIGASLTPFAINWITTNTIDTTSGDFNYWSLLIGILTALIICLVSRSRNDTLRTLPFLIGIGAGFAASLLLWGIGHLFNIDSLMSLISFEAFSGGWKWPEFAIINLFTKDSGFEWVQIPEIILISIPIALTAACEHIGDHLNLSSAVGKNLLEDPGLGKTLLGDGLATAAGGFIGGMGNTTYSENVGVIAATRIASSRVLIVTSIMSILIGFCWPLTALIQSIPIACFGGAALCLYGLIISGGVKQLQKVDLNDQKNLLITSVMLTCGIGGLLLPISGTFSIGGVCLAMILGVVLNLILKDKNL